MKLIRNKEEKIVVGIMNKTLELFLNGTISYQDYIKTSEIFLKNIDNEIK